MTRPTPEPAPTEPVDTAHGEGEGTQLAEWAIEAAAGRPASPDGLDHAAQRRLRRVNGAVAALREARAARATGEGGAAS